MRTSRRPAAGARRLSAAAGICLLAAGCATWPGEVSFPVSLPGPVDFSRLRSVAVLDFAVPLGAPEAGERLADRLVGMFRERIPGRVLDPGSARAFLRARRLSPGRFREAGVIREVGTGLQADAMLFGDVPVARVTRTTRPEVVTRLVTERRAVPVVDAAGNTRVVIRPVRVYRDFHRQAVERTAEIQVEARLVDGREGRVLWQNTVRVQGKFLAWEQENGIRTGDWRPDRALLEQMLGPAAERLLAGLFPPSRLRYRTLAVPAGGTEYAREVRAGNEAAQRGDWTGAGVRWSRAAGLQPQAPEARANLGVARERAGDAAAAAEAYAAAAERLGPPWSDYLREVQAREPAPGASGPDPRNPAAGEPQPESGK